MTLISGIRNMGDLATRALMNDLKVSGGILVFAITDVAVTKFFKKKFGNKELGMQVGLAAGISLTAIYAIKVLPTMGAFTLAETVPLLCGVGIVSGALQSKTMISIAAGGILCGLAKSSPIIVEAATALTKTSPIVVAAAAACVVMAKQTDLI